MSEPAPLGSDDATCILCDARIEVTGMSGFGNQPVRLSGRCVECGSWYRKADVGWLFDPAVSVRPGAAGGHRSATAWR